MNFMLKRKSPYADYTFYIIIYFDLKNIRIVFFFVSLGFVAFWLISFLFHFTFYRYHGDSDPPYLDYINTTGLTQAIKNNGSPQEYFEIFFNDINFEFLAQQTSLYAQQFLSSAKLTCSRYHRWRETNC